MFIIISTSALHKNDGRFLLLGLVAWFSAYVFGSRRNRTLWNVGENQWN